MTHPPTPTPTHSPTTVTLTERLESASALDPFVRAVQPIAGALVADQGRADALRGKWLGHALHPLMTDLPIGFWTSALTLDLIGGGAGRRGGPPPPPPGVPPARPPAGARGGGGGG